MIVEVSFDQNSRDLVTFFGFVDRLKQITGFKGELHIETDHKMLLISFVMSDLSLLKESVQIFLSLSVKLRCLIFTIGFLEYSATAFTKTLLSLVFATYKDKQKIIMKYNVFFYI